MFIRFWIKALHWQSSKSPQGESQSFMYYIQWFEVIFFFWLLHIRSSHNQSWRGWMFCTASAQCADLHPSFCGLLYEGISMFCYICILDTEYVEWRRAFLSKITLRNLYWSRTGISYPSSFSIREEYSTQYISRKVGDLDWGSLLVTLSQGLQLYDLYIVSSIPL